MESSFVPSVPVYLQVLVHKCDAYMLNKYHEDLQVESCQMTVVYTIYWFTTKENGRDYVAATEI